MYLVGGFTNRYGPEVICRLSTIRYDRRVIRDTSLSCTNVDSHNSRTAPTVSLADI